MTMAGELLVVPESAAGRDASRGPNGKDARRIRRLGTNVNYDTRGGPPTGYRRRVGKATAE